MEKATGQPEAPGKLAEGSPQTVPEGATPRRQGQGPEGTEVGPPSTNREIGSSTKVPFTDHAEVQPKLTYFSVAASNVHPAQCGMGSVAALNSKNVGKTFINGVTFGKPTSNQRNAELNMCQFGL